MYPVIVYCPPFFIWILDLVEDVPHEERDMGVEYLILVFTKVLM
jgi:hypothetical protein